MDSSSSHPPLGPEFVLRHAADVRRLARRLVQDDARADDLAQETWISALQRGLPAEPPQGWRRWLFGVARNVARETRRGEGRRARRQELAARPEALRDEPTSLERVEAFEVLARELGALSEPYRDTLVRRYFEGLSFADIAARQGTTEGTVRSRHARGLELLRERLDRRRPGGRAEWMALFATFDSPTAATPIGVGANVARFALWTSVAVTLGLVVALVLDEARRTVDSPVATVELGEPARTGAQPPLGSNTIGAEPLSPASSAPQATPGSSARVSAATTPSADEARVPLLVTIVDERNGDVLRDYRVRVGVLEAPDFEPLDVHSDDAGLVRLAAVPPRGTLSVTLIDHPALDALRRSSSGSRAFPWTIALPYAASAHSHPTVRVAASVGPTIRFDFVLAPDAPRADPSTILDGAWVELVGEDPVDPPRMVAAPLRGLESPRGPESPRGSAAASSPVSTVPIATASEATASNVAPREPRRDGPQRDGAHREAAAIPWARFGPDAPRADETSRRRIRVTSADGAWEGSTVLAPAIDAWIDRGTADDGPLVRVTLARVAEPADPTTRVLMRQILARQHAAPVPVEAPWSERARAEPHRTLKIRAVDAVTGARLDSFAASLVLDDDPGLSAVRTTSYGNLDFRDVPVASRVAFVVTAAGYRPSRGARADFAPDTDHDVALVRLVRGWQRTFVVTDGSATTGIAGVTVEIDGERVGTTDAQGRLLVTRTECPTRVDVYLGDLRAVRDAARPVDAPGEFVRYYLEN